MRCCHHHHYRCHRHQFYHLRHYCLTTTAAPSFYEKLKNKLDVPPSLILFTAVVGVMTLVMMYFQVCMCWQ